MREVAYTTHGVYGPRHSCVVFLGLLWYNISVWTLQQIGRIKTRWRDKSAGASCLKTMVLVAMVISSKLTRLKEPWLLVHYTLFHLF